MDTVTVIAEETKPAQVEIILKDDDVYLIDVDPTLVHTKPRTNAKGVLSKAVPKPYYRATYKGSGFMVSPLFFKQLEAGELVEVRLLKSSYFPIDPEGDGTTKLTKSRDSWTFGGKKTATQEFNSKLHRRRVTVIEKTDLNDVKFNESLFNRVQAAIAPKPVVAPELSDEVPEQE